MWVTIREIDNSFCGVSSTLIAAICVSISAVQLAWFLNSPVLSRKGDTLRREGWICFSVTWNVTGSCEFPQRIPFSPCDVGVRSDTWICFLLFKCSLAPMHGFVTCWYGIFLMYEQFFFFFFLKRMFLKSSVELDIKAVKIIVHLWLFKMVFCLKLYLLLIPLQLVCFWGIPI